MTVPDGKPTICVVTPTFRRAKFLRRFLPRMLRQTYPAWRLIVVHDGPDAEIERLVAGYRARDPRVEFITTPERTNDYGVGPRHEGARHAVAAGPADYTVFWDDDNEFRPDALQGIAEAAEARGRPDCLIVSMGWQGQVLPPKAVPLDQFVPGHVDTGNLVLRSRLALDGQAELLRRKQDSPGVIFVSDFTLYDIIRSHQPKPRIAGATEVFVGYHDGLRWGPYLRRRLGIPSLDLRRRPWFAALTFSKVRYR